MPEHGVPACPDLETLAAFVDGRVDASTSAAIAEHLPGCEQCYELVSELAMELAEHTAAPGAAPAAAPPVEPIAPAATTPARSAWNSGWMRLAATVVLVGGTAAGLQQANPGWWQRLMRTAPDSALTPLVQAVGDQRPIEGRLSGGFRYGPLIEPTRAATLATDNLSLAAAAGTLQKQADADRSPGTLHAWGVAQVLVGRLDEGIRTLTRVQADHAQVAAYANDLGVAHMTRALASERADDLPRALDLVEQAIEIDPRFAEAWFNKAMLLQRLRVRQQAIDAWGRYLELDPGGAWSAYAKQQRDALVAQPPQGRWPALEKELRGGAAAPSALAEAAQAFPEDVRDLVVRDWLPEWAAMVAAGRQDEARRVMARVQSAFAAMNAAHPDPYLSLVASELAETPACPPAVHAGAVVRLGEGLKALATDNNRSARDPLNEAERGLTGCGSALATWVLLDQVRLAYADRDTAGAQAILDRVNVEAARLDSPVLMGRSGWLGGILAFTIGEWRRAAAEYDGALRAAARSGETQLASRVHLNASVLHRFLGNRERTWFHRQAAVDLVPAHRPSQFHGYLLTGAITAALQSLPRTALLFQNEVVAFARERLPVSHSSEGLFTRARMRARLGQTAAAVADLEAADKAVQAFTDPLVRERVRRSYSVAAAEVYVDLDPRRAAGHAADAIRFTGSAERMRSAEMRLIESRALANLSDLAAARTSASLGIADFEAALDTFDPSDSTRLSALEPVWQLYSHAARLHLPPLGNDFATAFDFSERSRSRTLLARRRQKPLTLAAVQSRLADGQAVLLLDQLPNELLTWWIRKGRVQVERSACSERDITAMLPQHRRALGDGVLRDEVSARLFDCAVRPLWRHVQGVTTIAIVADASWHAVAWPALWDRSSGQLLVDRVHTVVSPSASIAVGAGRAASADGAILIISATGGESGYAPLPGARDEARSIARLHPGAQLIEGDAATPALLVKSAPTARLIHVASHAIDVPAYPLMSHLVLAGADPSLFARDIAAMDLSKTEAVVLAACATAGERSVRGEGSVGVAWGFLTAGARRVIATLDEVDDTAIGDVFVAVHRHLAAGRSAVDAVGRVQRELATRGESPRTWAMLTVVGAL